MQRWWRGFMGSVGHSLRNNGAVNAFKIHGPTVPNDPQRSNPSFQDSATLHLPYARECAVHECELDRRNNDTCLQYLRNWPMVYLLWQFAALQLSTHVPALQTDKIPLAWPCLVTTNCRRGAHIYVNMHMYVSASILYIYMCVCAFTVYTYMHYTT